MCTSWTFITLQTISHFLELLCNQLLRTTTWTSHSHSSLPKSIFPSLSDDWGTDWWSYSDAHIWHNSSFLLSVSSWLYKLHVPLRKISIGSFQAIFRLVHPWCSSLFGPEIMVFSARMHFRTWHPCCYATGMWEYPMVVAMPSPSWWTLRYHNMNQFPVYYLCSGHVLI